MWNVIKTKIRCKKCGDIIIPTNNTEWFECACGAIKVLGKDTFKAVNGKKEDYEDLTLSDFKNVPPHRQ